jgi:hypothetical protein
MRRIAVIAITALATLAVTAAVGASVFTIRPAGADGYLLLTSKQGTECDTGGGCAVLSNREFHDAVLMLLKEIQQRKGVGLSS